MYSNKGYLRSQFQAADKTSSGYLLPHEFGELLRQLNIDMTSKEIADVFDEVNTDLTEIEGKQVIDEKEFLAFYESLMEREVLHVIFDQVRGTNKRISLKFRHKNFSHLPLFI